MAGKVTTLLRKKTGAQIPGTAMYTHNTIEAISKVVEEKGGQCGKEFKKEPEPEVKRRPGRPKKAVAQASEPMEAKAKAKPKTKPKKDDEPFQATLQAQTAPSFSMAL